MWSAWWIWMLAALVFGVVEVLAPSYIMLGFAIGAGLIGLGLLTGFLGPLVGLAGGYGFASLLVAFAVLSLIAWIALRAVFGPPGAAAQTFDDDVND
ncbi:NfeD family protein [Jannaschia sp. KMU-145]|uniref:NfeD family protein n=1 Tax=Jannaschia halovivens TaxID=3388667 RepID=UPI00396B3D75